MSKKKKRQEAVCDIDQDGNFAFIAGYTPGGFPYGITWEEQAEIDRRERKGQLADEGPDNPDFSFEAARNHTLRKNGIRSGREVRECQEGCKMEGKESSGW
jgi:hypothetical protein